MKKLLWFGLLATLGVGVVISWKHRQSRREESFAVAADGSRRAVLAPSAAAAAVSAASNAPAAVEANAAMPAPGNLPPVVGQTQVPAGQERRRAWNYAYLDEFRGATKGGAVRFELVAGEFASGTIQRLEFQNGQVMEVAGELAAPEAGRFSFRRQTVSGKAGDFVGEVLFPLSLRAFRIEPTGPNGTSELVERRMDEVLCLTMPKMDAATAAALDADEIPPLDPQDVPDYVPAYNDGIISLQSRPGSPAVIYIDYRGGYNNNNWGSFPYDKPNVSNATIKDVWKRVAEDYMPFNINVTTDIKVYEACPQGRRQRCAVTPTSTAAPGAGGVAWLGSWDWSGDTPCWSFYTGGKAAAEVISHEIGHTLELGHDGRTSPSEGYYGGQGSGAVGWAPIMGVGYYQNVAQWSKGEYDNANNTQNDLTVIVNNNNNVDYRADDTGATLATARYLELYSDYTAAAEGVIEQTADTDAFRFTTADGAISLTASPVGSWANLAIMATLADASDTIIASNNPQTQLSASIATNLPAGTYTFRVTGAGRNNPLTDGFSSYASLGYYSVSGSVAGGTLPSRFTVLETATNATVVGTVTATNLGVDPLVYFITSGNTSSAFAINSNGVLTVANSGALNYETLAAQTQLTVQYQLFVNITNTANPSLTELNRRVVVQVLDVNESPTISAFTNTVIAHTLPGTVVGTVAASDPDFYTVLTLAIVSGNSNGMFALNSSSGAITVVGDLNSAVQNVYSLKVEAKDNGTPRLSGTNTVQITVITNATPFQPGSLSYAVYDGIGSGSLVSDLTGNARFPTDPTWERQETSFEGGTDRADSYGSAMRGFLIPPQSGSYTFFIASDDNSELWISTTTNPASMTLAASISGSGNWASPRQWTKFASQTSTARSLTAGQGYYIEARQKDGSGGDNLAVGWKGPATVNLTNVIPGVYLAPRFINYLPRLAGFTNNGVRRDTLAGAKLGRLTVTDANSTDTHTFTILSGNTGGIFSVDASGWVRVADQNALQSSVGTNFSLSIRATDSGTPPLSATGGVALTIVDSNAITATTLQRELFYYLGSGTAVGDLTGSAKYPGKPDALTAVLSGNFDTADDIADGYGSRIRGFVVPSVSGDYQFFIASDDNGQLKFSLTTNPASATVIASVSGWTAGNEWSKYPSQTSALQTLVAGQRYYIEALQKDGGGGDDVSVGWLVPGSGVTNVIPAANLQPVDIGVAPSLANQTLSMLQGAASGAVIGRVAAADSPLEALTFAILSGNTSNVFTLASDTGDLVLVSNTPIASGALSNFSLTVAVQDSGYGGKYPLRSSQAIVTVVVTNAPAASQPSPASNEFNVEFDRILTWSGVNGVQHDVYFGTSAAAVTAATTASPEYRGRQSALTFDPGALLPSVNYYWRIDEISGSFVTKGAVWRFSTAETSLAGRLLVHLTFDNADLSGPVLTNILDFAPLPDRFALSATTGQPGTIGEAFSFNNGYARSFSNDIIPAGTPGGTMSAWIKTTSTAVGTHILSVEGAWVLSFQAGGMVAFFDGSSSGNATMASGLSDNNWHHLLAANDGANTAVYVDGTLRGNYAEDLYDLGTLTRQTCVGARYDGAGTYYSGSVDDAMIWGRALSADEAYQIYTNGLTGKTVDPVTVVTRTGFEAAEGFSGYATNTIGVLGTKTNSDGSVWAGLGGDVQIWYRGDVPQKGWQCFKLGETTADALCRVQIPGTNHGAGIVMFDWASFSSSSSGTVSLSWSNKFSGGWVTVWTNTLAGLNPDWAAKPWPTVAVPINAVGDVDLLFKRVGNKGVVIDNFRLTGRASNAPFFLADPTISTNLGAGVAFADTLSGRASDVDLGDAITFSKVSGPAWLSVAAGGALSGTPAGADAGVNDFIVRVTDSLGATGDSTLHIVVTNSTPPNPPAITSSVSGTNLQMQVTSQNGYTYILQSTPSLLLPVVWSGVATNAGTGGVLNFSAPVDPAQPQNFFRVVAY